MMQDQLTDVERVIKQINGSLERRLFVIAGPSGVGKNTIIKELLANHPQVMDRIRTYTTRSQRDNEVEGMQYYFVSTEHFESLAREDRLLEADAEHPRGHDVYGTDDSYSMPADLYEDVSPEAHIVIAEVDVAGAERLRKLIPNCVTIFITAPPQDLIDRIYQRPDKDMTPDKVQQRMKTAKEQIQAAKDFDYVVYNIDGHLAETMSCVEAIVYAERMKVYDGFDLEKVLPPNAFEILEQYVSQQ